MVKYLEIKCGEDRACLAIEVNGEVTMQQLNARVKCVTSKCTLTAAPGSILKFMCALSDAYDDWKISLVKDEFLDPVIFSSARKKQMPKEETNQVVPGRRRGRRPRQEEESALTTDTPPVSKESIPTRPKHPTEPKDIVADLIARQATRNNPT